MNIYLIICVCNRMFGFSILINHVRPDINFGWSYFSLILHLGHSTHQNGWEIINWFRKRKIDGWSISQVITKGEDNV